MSKPNDNLNELIESTRQEVQAQQVKADALASQTAPQPRGKQILTLLLMAALAVVLIVQFPRFSEPYSRPDPTTNPGAAEANLIEMVSLIEEYRLTQGRYPAVLSQLALPEALAARVAESAPIYRPSDSAYTLAWTLPHWQTSYDSQTEKTSVTPLAKR